MAGRALLAGYHRIIETQWNLEENMFKFSVSILPVDVQAHLGAGTVRNLFSSNFKYSQYYI